MKPLERQAVVRCPAISFGSKALWFLLESYADRDGTNAYPSHKTIMLQMGCKEKWVDVHLRELKDWGLISVESKQVGGGWPVNLYTLHVPLKRGHIMCPQKDTVHVPPKKGHHHSPIPKKKTSAPKNIIRLPKPKKPPEEDHGSA